MDLSNYAMFGDHAGASEIPASLMSTNADGSTDWNKVLAGGIRGAAQQAISQSVGEKFADGQLVAEAQAASKSDKTTNIVLVAVALYMLMGR